MSQYPLGSYNFKKIVTLLRQLQEYHLQLQAFGIGDINQLIYYTEERLKIDNTTENLAPYYPLADRDWETIFLKL